MKSRRELAYLQEHTGWTTTCGQSRQETCLQCEREQREKKGLLSKKHERRGMTCCWELNKDITICKAVNIQPPPQWTLWSCKSRYSIFTDPSRVAVLEKEDLCIYYFRVSVAILEEFLYLYTRLFRAMVLRKKWNYLKVIELQKFIRTGEICRLTCA